MMNDKVLITGGSGGIGNALCNSFANAGYTVILHYNSNQERAESVLKKLPGTDHITIKADLSDVDQISAMFESIENIDVVINNAAVVEPHNLNILKYEEWVDVWRRTIDTNLIGSAHIMFFASRAMKKNGGGKFINISSRGAFRGEPSAPAYGASKAGLNSLGQSMAVALAKDNIFVYTLAPGFVNTDRVKDLIDDKVKSQSPLNRVAKPEEVAKTALWLAKEDNEFLTGSIIDINGASYLRS